MNFFSSALCTRIYIVKILHPPEPLSLSLSPSVSFFFRTFFLRFLKEFDACEFNRAFCKALLRDEFF